MELTRMVSENSKRVPWLDPQDILQRTRAIKHWIKEEQHNIDPRTFLNFLLSPGTRNRAMRVIESIEKENDFYVVSLRGLASPLFYPSGSRVMGLLKTVTEIMDTNDWHYYEKPETRVAKSDTVLDCGAAEGLFALTVQDRSIRVYCYEPSRKFVDSMKRTFEFKGNVVIQQSALSDFEGRASLSMNSEASSINVDGQGEDVAVTTVDACFFDSGIEANFLKIDVEGSETKLLRGAAQTIRKNGPRIAAAAYHYRGQAEDIVATLREIEPKYQIAVYGFHTWTEPIGVPIMVHAWRTD